MAAGRHERLVAKKAFFVAQVGIHRRDNPKGKSTSYICCPRLSNFREETPLHYGNVTVFTKFRHSNTQSVQVLVCGRTILVGVPKLIILLLKQEHGNIFYLDEHERINSVRLYRISSNHCAVLFTHMFSVTVSGRFSECKRRGETSMAYEKEAGTSSREHKEATSYL